MKSIYPFEKNFADNWVAGLNCPARIPERILAPRELWPTIFGHKVASPLGVPACCLTTGRGIAQLSKFGLDIFTYKTMRSMHFTSHEPPNVAFVDCKRQIEQHDIRGTFGHSNALDKESYAIAGSFGNPSFVPEIMHEDIQRAKNGLSDGQLLIVSVYGTEQPDRTLAQDFLYAATIAQEAGAQVIEANFSCPNIPGEPPIYKQTELLYTIIQTMTRNLNIPLCIKVGIHDNKEQLYDLLVTAARAGAQGVCGINSVPITFLDKNNEPYFGQRRATCGLSGGPIRNLALNWTRDARDIVTQEKLPLTLLSAGGIVRPEHFTDFLNAGADVAMSAAGIMFDPYIAATWQEQHKTHTLKKNLSDAQTL